MDTFFESFPQPDLSASNRVFHTPSKFAKESLLYVQETGTLKSLRSHRCKREKLDSFLFVIVLSGRGEFTVKDQIYQMSALDCAFIDCMEPYSHQSSVHEPWELMWVHFNGAAARGYYNFFMEHALSSVFHPDSIQKFTSKIAKLMTLQENPDFTSELESSKLITDILTLIFAVIKGTKQEADLKLKADLESLRRFLNENYQNDISVDDLALKFSLDKDALYHDFKRTYGISINKYILSRRLTRAKELLRFSNKSVDDVARACGMKDVNYFVEIFQDSENMEPLQYRMKWSQGA